MQSPYLKGPQCVAGNHVYGGISWQVVGGNGVVQHIVQECLKVSDRQATDVSVEKVNVGKGWGGVKGGGREDVPLGMGHCGESLGKRTKREGGGGRAGTVVGLDCGAGRDFP